MQNASPMKEEEVARMRIGRWTHLISPLPFHPSPPFIHFLSPLSPPPPPSLSLAQSISEPPELRTNESRDSGGHQSRPITDRTRTDLCLPPDLKLARLPHQMAL